MSTTTASTDQRIEVWMIPTNTHSRFPCSLCDGTTSKEDSIAEVVTNPDSDEAERIGDVCRTCIESGDVPARLGAKIAGLEEYIAHLRGLLDYEWTLPSITEWHAAQNLTAAAYEEECGDPDSVIVKPGQLDPHEAERLAEESFKGYDDHSAPRDHYHAVLAGKNGGQTK